MRINSTVTIPQESLAITSNEMRLAFGQAFASFRANSDTLFEGKATRAMRNATDAEIAAFPAEVAAAYAEFKAEDPNGLYALVLTHQGQKFFAAVSESYESLVWVAQSADERVTDVYGSHDA